MRQLPKLVRQLLVVVVLAATSVSFAVYFVQHPEVRHQLVHTSPILLVGLLALYGVAIASLGMILKATLILCRVTLPLRESVLVTMYSAIINFFGPLQSGPAFRAVYLKRRHGLELKKYTLATLTYYIFYGAISVAMLLSGWLGWWLAVFVSFGCLLLWLLYRSKLKVMRRFQALQLTGLGYLGLATALQSFVTLLIYYLELHALNGHIHFSQAVVYTGAANLALFVSITPGAIGFRESFLVFSRHLHHISNGTIVAANIIDRSVYIVMLLVLLVTILGTHAQRRLDVRGESH